ncbi:hypothetical protein SPRG_06896 [Saprolegnia parasitica CBS 223.65]|uniref:Uncharacterized protein n=1 Tax=Saprolegnia parasitica (strain CBS 223.65) TaxID=695850 RepID=A0A067CM65_SAPPC|nr:hypothetical protein SPRG_06896 [Saprolegnia parasitica CBS 223.65]KDO27626.1 hypothetical protein SPRG_06896 [Saprolegnia parasitica CBS 223.65]|eukprot:XP_012201748.1 hypothetical protein SPRG_06896 [Saprolegnia parasitica CBS 223.65]
MKTTSPLAPCGSQRAAPIQEQVAALDTAFFHSSESPCIGNDPAESLTTAIQALQPLLTKSAAATYPSHILDFAVQCIAALPVETSAVVREIQKLRYVLPDQMPCSMVARSVMHAPPSTSLSIASKPEAHNVGWSNGANPTSQVSINGQYAADAHAMTPETTRNVRPKRDMDQAAMFSANSQARPTETDLPRSSGSEKPGWAQPATFGRSASESATGI